MPNTGFVVFAVSTGLVVIAVAAAVVLVVLLVTMSMRGRQIRAAQRRRMGRHDTDRATERAAPAEAESDTARESREDPDRGQ